MISFDEYIGIPYLKDGNDRNGIDCWRLYVMVCREIMGIELPELRGIFFGESLPGLRRAIKAARECKKMFTRVEKPKPFDAVLLRAKPLHIGTVIDRKRMLHIDEGVNSIIEEFTSLQWKQKVEGFYRWKTIEK